MTMKKKLKIQKKTEAKFNILRIIAFMIILFVIVSCSTKPQSLKIIKTIKEDVKQTAIKIDAIEKEYSRLIIEKPQCRNEIIIDNIKETKSDIAGLSNKIAIAEYVIQTETKACQNEIKATKATNILLKVFLLASTIGLTFLLTKLRK